MAIAYDASVQTPYFKGVQGDTSNTGELFGLENIFSFQENESATKMAIENANIAQLEWAMENMTGKGVPRKGKKASDPNNADLLAVMGKEDVSPSTALVS